MRRALLVSLSIIALVAISVQAIELFKKKTPSIDPKVIATLKSLTPTEAEAKAIAELREKTKKRYYEFLKQNKYAPVIMPPEPDAATSAPTTADVAANSDGVQISLAYMLISVVEPLAQKIISEPAMDWVMLLNGLNPPSASAYSDRTSLFSINAEVPTQVRFLDEANTQKFYNLMQAQRTANVLELPKAVIASGGIGSINDVCEIPFVTGILSFEVDGGRAYEPIIKLYKNGFSLTFKATHLENGSCRLDECRFELSRITKMDEVCLLEGETTKISKTSGITVQVPTFASLCANIPEIEIPEGMSLLVSFPGAPAVELGKDSGTTFLLITPKVCDSK
jgi:predicted DNA-binding WGR domain protein